MSHIIKTIAIAVLLGACSSEVSQPASSETSMETEVHAATIAANKASVKALDFSDRRDFDRVNKGFIATFDDGIPNFDPTAYAFLDGDAPDSVNPSLWRQSQLLSKHGLYKVRNTFENVDV